MKSYEQTIEYLYNQYPVFQHIGANAYKPGLERSYLLDNLFHHPHKSYKTIHVGGTNGKGSTSHALAAILQKAGYKVGLYTSPHLVDFRERIRVNGEMINKDYIINFVNQGRKDFEPLHCSFFELTMMMSFCYFKDQNVDFAIIEVGLGGLLDSTNIINPILSIITNISYDHVQFLGNTLSLIAQQKAGIIKENTPIIIGSTTVETRKIFEEEAYKKQSKLYFAEDKIDITITASDNQFVVDSLQWGIILYELGGFAQKENIKTILTAVEVLLKLGVTDITPETVQYALSHIIKTTHLRGRWEVIRTERPLIICDTGHNIAGIKQVVRQLESIKSEDLRIIIGFANDKDISHILDILPQNAKYYYVAAKISRAMDAEFIQKRGEEKGLKGKVYLSINEAYQSALLNVSLDTCIFVGGSNFVVGEFLQIIG